MDTTRPATIYDVARHAGVSHQTVSRVIKGSAHTAATTRDRVLASIDSLSYRPNSAARALTTGRSTRLVALIHDVVQVGPATIIQGASVAARELGYVLDVVAFDASDRRAVASVLETLVSPQPAAILVLASTDEMVRAITAFPFDVPLYIAGGRDDELRLGPPEIAVLVDHLFQLGHRNVIHVTGPRTWITARKRARAIEAALSLREMQIVATLEGDWSARGGFEALDNLELDRGATAVIAANDQTAIGVMRALHKRGVTVPDDMSVVGYDDIPEAAYLQPPLTTLRIDFAEEGRRGVAELLARANFSSSRPSESSTAAFVSRESTGPAPAIQ